ncbi:MAG TPA: hypothetical protein V6C52_01780, partial [Coleofasciculaceae cyanobacterium]
MSMLQFGRIHSFNIQEGFAFKDKQSSDVYIVTERKGGPIQKFKSHSPRPEKRRHEVDFRADRYVQENKIDHVEIYRKTENVCRPIDFD